MATIVRHTKTGAQYALLGTGYGAFHSKNENLFFGNWAPDVDEGQYAMVCVCDKKGRLGWVESIEVEVVSIDGQAIASIFESE